MKKYLSKLLLLSILSMGMINAATTYRFSGNFQNDLLGEYEQRLILIEKQFADYKRSIDPTKMSTMDVKMKVGGFENNRNTLKAKLRDLRKLKRPLSQTDQGDLDKRFESLTKEFEELKKITE